MFIWAIHYFDQVELLFNHFNLTYKDLAAYKNSNTKAYFDKEAFDFDVSYKSGLELKDFVRRLAYRWNQPLIIKRLRSLVHLAGDCTNRLFLEVGIGAGHYSIELVKAGAEKVVGIDFSKGMMRCAKDNINQLNLQDSIELVEGDFFEIGPQYDANFDVSFACGVLDYIEPNKQELFVRQITACTKNGGHVIISFPKNRTIHAIIRKVWLNLFKKIPVFFYSQDDILSLTKSAGLFPIEDIDCGALTVRKFQKQA